LDGLHYESLFWFARFSAVLLNDKRGALAAENTPTSLAVVVEEVGSEEL
jgi:hypothetical protein